MLAACVCISCWCTRAHACVRKCARTCMRGHACSSYCSQVAERLGPRPWVWSRVVFGAALYLRAWRMFCCFHVSRFLSMLHVSFHLAACCHRAACWPPTCTIHWHSDLPCALRWLHLFQDATSRAGCELACQAGHQRGKHVGRHVGWWRAPSMQGRKLGSRQGGRQAVGRHYYHLLPSTTSYYLLLPPTTCYHHLGKLGALLQLTQAHCRHACWMCTRFGIAPACEVLAQLGRMVPMPKKSTTSAEVSLES